jgi:hypothetical protein
MHPLESVVWLVLRMVERGLCRKHPVEAGGVIHETSIQRWL